MVELLTLGSRMIDKCNEYQAKLSYCNSLARSSRDRAKSKTHFVESTILQAQLETWREALAMVNEVIKSAEE